MLIPANAPHPRAARWLLACFVVVVIAAVVLHVLFEGATGRDRVWPVIALGAGAPVLVALLWCAAVRSRLVVVATAALFFCWLGDAFGVSLVIKLGFFLVAQIAFVVAFWPYRQALRRRWPLAVAYALGIAVAVTVVARDAGSLMIPVLAYGLTLGAMAVLAFGLDLTTGLGGLLFLISDIELGIAAFVAPGLIPYPGAVNSALYLPGLLLLVLGLAHRGARNA